LLHFLRISSLPQRAPLYLSLSLTCFDLRYGFLECIFGLINSWCPPRLLSALTQTVTVVIC
ncbi:unnamed protein product, partial [Hymenolepis diminuta]